MPRKEKFEGLSLPVCVEWINTTAPIRIELITFPDGSQAVEFFFDPDSKIYSIERAKQLLTALTKLLNDEQRQIGTSKRRY